MRFRFLAFTLIALAVNPPVFGQSRAPVQTLKAANQCAQISVTGNSTVGIQIEGTFSATLQPQVSIQGQSAQNSQVTPSNSATPQSTVTSAGVYSAGVAGADTFLLCVSSYVSGSATVYLNATTASNKGGTFGGGGTGNVNGTGTANVVTKWTGTATVGNSQMTDDGTDPVGSPDGYDASTTGAYSNDIANDTVTGTTINALACNNGAAKVVVCPAASSTTNAPIGTVIVNAGTSGNATVAYLGLILNCFDNQSVVLDWAVESTTLNGCLHDTGSTSQTPGQPNYLVWTANAGANTNGYYRLLTADDFAAQAAAVTGCTVNGGSSLGPLCNFQNGTGTTVTNPSGNNVQVNLVPVPIAVTVTADPAPTTANNGEFYQLNYSGAGNFTLPASIPAAQWAVVASNISASTVTIQGNGNNVCSLTCAGTLSLPAGAQFYLASSSGQYVASILASGTLSGTTNRVVKFTSATAGGNSQITDDGTNPTKSPLGFNVSTAGGYDFDLANNAATGTTSQTATCDDGSGLGIVCPHTTSTTNQPIGFVVSGAGKAGNATLCNLGWCTVLFDNSTTAKHYAIASTTTDGELHDSGTTLTAGQPNYLIWTANGGIGLAGQVRLLTADDFTQASVSVYKLQVGGTALTAGDTVNLNNTTPAAGTNGLNIHFQTSKSGTTDSVSGEVVGDGTAAHYLGGTGTFTQITSIGATTGTSLLVTGILDGLAPVTLTTGASCTLGTASGCNATKYLSGYTFNQEASAATAITYTLPTAAVGLQYCVKNSYNGSAADTGTLEILTSASGQFIIVNGTPSATGGYVISGGAAGDAACVVGISTTQWEFYAQVGTWAQH